MAQDAMQVLQTIGSTLQSFNETLQQAQVPDEIKQMMQQVYDGFVQVAQALSGGGQGQAREASSAQDPNAPRDGSAPQQAPNY